MNFLTAVILGIVEGITEFLPVSSTGHLILAADLLKVPLTDFMKSFEIAIQLGAILAVVFLYRKSLLVHPEALKKVAAAFLPAAVMGFLLYRMIKHYLLASRETVLWALFLGGIFLVVFEKLHREKPDAEADIANISYRKAVFIGFFQCLALVPGVSRAAATVIGGLLAGLKRKTIVEFSFLLAVPTMAAAAGLDLLQSSAAFSRQEFLLLAAGFVVSFGVAVMSVKWLLRFIQGHSFIVFGAYRAAIALVFWFLKP